MAGQRIEYIDAMRGFTMILVAYSHVCNYCLGDVWMGCNDVFFLFRMPCFFFISGWLFGLSGSQPFWPLVRKKFMVQIVPTFIFLLLLAPPPLFFSRLGATKGGYWFTFALFEYFVLYLLSVRLFKRWSGLFAVVVSVAAFCYDVLFNRYFTSMGWLTCLLGFLSFMTWRYYLFFFIGTWVRRHFEGFLHLTGRPYVMLVVVIGFCAITLIPRSDNLPLEYFIFAFGGVLGMTMVFTFFRRFARFFSRERVMGRVLQYIGTRTLDIYLLHYFFLPRFLLPFGERLRGYDSLPLEMTVALLLALAVIGVSLLVSYIIRLSPVLAHYLFGVKYGKAG